MGKFAVVFCLAVGLTGCQLELEPQKACGFVQNSDERRVSWKTKRRIDLYVHESVPARFDVALRKAVKGWNELLFAATGVSGIMHFALDAEGGHGDNAPIVKYPGANKPTRDARSTVHLMSTWDSKKSSQQAVTTTYWTGALITEADIRFNGRHFDFFVGQGVESTEHGHIHFESLSLHEKGHLLGLAHSQSSGSVMRPSLSANYERLLRVEGHDYDALKCEYALYHRGHRL